MYDLLRHAKCVSSTRVLSPSLCRLTSGSRRGRRGAFPNDRSARIRLERLQIATRVEAARCHVVATVRGGDEETRDVSVIYRWLRSKRCCARHGRTCGRDSREAAKRGVQSNMSLLRSGSLLRDLVPSTIAGAAKRRPARRLFFG